MPQFSIKCLRKHLISDKQYTLQIIEDLITISYVKKNQCPKYKYIIDTSLIVDWKVSHQTNQVIMQAVGFLFSNKIKWFYANHDDLHQLKSLLGPNIIQKGLGYFYQPLQTLGTGGSSQIFLAQDLINKKLFAVKGISEKKKTQNVKNEITGLKIPSLYIAKMREVYALENNYFIVLEFLQGGDLEFQLGEPIDENVTRRILKQILLGIQDLNDYNFVHKDIQPKNIMLTEQGDVKLIDFGQSNEADQRNNICYGTPGYCAPEMFDQNKKITFSADIFSVGCVFYKMITGKDLFSGQSVEEILMKNKLCQIDLYGLNISNQGLQLLKKMLIKDPQNRITAKECLNHVYFLKDTFESIHTFKSCQSISNIPDDQSISSKVPLMNDFKFKRYENQL